MKNKLRTILLVLVLMFSFMLNVNADVIKEDPKEYVGDAFVIGSSRFDASIIVTGAMASQAGAREMIVQYNVYENYDFDPEDIKVYYYSGIDEAWAVLPETSEDEFRFLDEEETKKLEDNLNIYYVNEVEKTLEIPFEMEIELEEGFEIEYFTHSEKYAKQIKHENGKLIMPATTGYLEISATKGNPEDDDYDYIHIAGIKQEEGELKLESASVETRETLQELIDRGTEYIQILESIDLPTALEITSKVEFYIPEDVELTVKEDTEGYGVFHVLDGGDLTINGMGTINGVGKNKWNIVIFAEGGKVTLNGGTYTNKDLKIMEDDTDSDHFDVIYAKGNAQVEIYGGYYEGKTPAWLLNIHDGSRKTANITVYGGTFEGFNPADNEAEGKGTSFLAEGHKIKAYDGIYYASKIDKYDIAIVNDIAYYSLQEAIAMAPAKSTIKLLQDVEVETAIHVTKEVTLDLNGHNITIPNDTVGDGVFYVPEGGKLTINGEGTINGVGKSEYTMAIWANGGEVIINGGTYTNVGSGDDNQYDLIYAKNGGKITINGGYFISETPKWTLNAHDKTESTIEVKGGTFKDYNPAEVYTEPTQPKNFVASGYKVTESEGEYTVIPADETDIVIANGVNYTTLKDAIDHASPKSTVTLIKDIDVPTAVVVEKEVTLDLNGHDLTITEDTVGDGIFHVLEGGILTINGEGTLNGVGKSEYTMAIWADGGEVIINGGTYTNVGSGDEEQYDLIYAKNGGKITINGGYFISETPKWTLNAHDKTESTIEVKGGTFKDYNPAEVYTEPTQPKNFVAEGYKVTKSNDEYTVEAE